MINTSQLWIPAIILLFAMRTVKVQFAMPMPMFQPPPQPIVMMAPPPPPVQVPVGVPYPVPIPVMVTMKTTTTTTTTTQAPNEANGGGNKFAVAFPLPFGFPMPFVLPQAPPPSFCVDKPRPKQCPPCPPCVCAPSCTPAFYSFCSSCHQKCRCKSNGDTPRPEPPRPPPPIPMLPAPMPAPMPMPAFMPPPPAPIFIFPLPPAMPIRRPPRKTHSSLESKSSDRSGSGSSSDTDNDSYDSRRRKRKRKSHITFRRFRNMRSLEVSDGTGTDVHETKLVKPMLSYISRRGEVKYEKKISEDDAARLMETDKSKSFEMYKNSRRSSNADKEVRRKKSNLSKQDKDETKKKVKADGVSYLIETDRSNSVEKIKNGVRSGGKDSRTVIFNPPPNKKITNLTVSFNVIS